MSKCVYIHFCGETNKPIYVGQGTIKRPFSCDKSRSDDYMNYIVQHGVKIKIIEKNLPAKIAAEFEEALIDFIGLDNLFNKLSSRSEWCKTHMIGINRGRIGKPAFNKGKKLNKITGKYQ